MSLKWLKRRRRLETALKTKFSPMYTIVNRTDDLPRHETKRYKTRSLDIIDTVVIHHSATRSGSPDSFSQYHIENNDWPGIGYHFVIDSNGVIHQTNDLNVNCYHARGYNTRSVGIVFIGNFDVQIPSMNQIDAGKHLVRILSLLFKGVKVIGHRDVPNTTKSCPGLNFNVSQLLPNV